MEWQWTEWDLNPRLPPCEGGDLPLIYRPALPAEPRRGLIPYCARAPRAGGNGRVVRITQRPWPYVRRLQFPHTVSTPGAQTLRGTTPLGGATRTRKP